MAVKPEDCGRVRIDRIGIAEVMPEVKILIRNTIITDIIVTFRIKELVVELVKAAASLVLPNNTKTNLTRTRTRIVSLFFISIIRHPNNLWVLLNVFFFKYFFFRLFV